MTPRRSGSSEKERVVSAPASRQGTTAPTLVGAEPRRPALLPAPLRALPSVGREPLPRQVREAHQRDHILAASTPVFAERGYHATTVEDIITAAHVGVGSFYALLDGKEDCFLRACDQILATVPERLASALSPEADWPTQVRAGLAAAIELIEAEPSQARLLLVEAQTAGPAGLERHQALIERAASFLRQGRALTPFGSQLPESLELTLASGVAWLLGQRAGLTQDGSLAGLREEVATFLLGPYLGREAAEASARSKRGCA